MPYASKCRCILTALTRPARGNTHRDPAEAHSDSYPGGCEPHLGNYWKYKQALIIPFCKLYVQCLEANNY